jgi:hypothetical protein
MAKKALITLSRQTLPGSPEKVHKKMNVFVVDTNKKPLIPCSPAKARKLLSQSKAAVFRRYPFTVILNRAVTDTSHRHFRLKIDPGSKFTGLAILDGKRIIWAAELKHRGQVIKNALESRRAVRRGRRNRNTRYRQPRFLNRTRPKGWLPPSLMSRVFNIITWVKRLMLVCPISHISMELAKFDMQKMLNPEISGVEYQHGELMGYEVREYLLEKFGRTCIYCGAKNVPFEIEHVIPKSKGGSDRVSNLTLACRECNQKKGNQSLEDFLKTNKPLIAKIKKQLKTPLKDAAAINATRWRLYNELFALGLTVEVGSGALTKHNRTANRLNKSHWADAACVGESTPNNLRLKITSPLLITASGFGNRQMCITDKHGFPKKHRGRDNVSNGFQTGDMVVVCVPKAVTRMGKPLKTAGRYIARVNGIVRGSSSISLNIAKNWFVHSKYLKKIHSKDGYGYSFTTTETEQQT